MSSFPPPQIGSTPGGTDDITLSVKPLYGLGKRLFDLLLSGVMLVLLSPLWLIIAFWISLDSRGPVFYVQTVLGLEGKLFHMYKFRSMLPNSCRQESLSDLEQNFFTRRPTASDEKGPIYKTAAADKNRITRVGRFLRETSLDELPQLWNVFCGDMSLVGPRPALPEEACLYNEHQRGRFAVRPGITGLYQVTARHRVPIQDMIEMDLEYVRRQSLRLDLEILFKTPAAMLSGL